MKVQIVFFVLTLLCQKLFGLCAAWAVIIPIYTIKCSQGQPTVQSSQQMIQKTVKIETMTIEDSSPAPRNDCGIDSKDRILGGENTDLDEFPWMALMGYKTKNNQMTYQCGGALINHRYVLTAAHCVVGEIEQKVGRLTTVRLGEHNTQTDPDCDSSGCAPSVQEIPIHQSVPHPQYEDSTSSRKNDIAIVRLALRAQISNYVKPICLGTRSTSLVAGDGVFVAGWGTAEQNRSSEVKLKVELPIFDKDECSTKYQKLGTNLWDKHICAGGQSGRDSCKGDSGGPLMKKMPNGVWEAVALVSFGLRDCGRDGWPGVYTKVADYLDWIENTLWSTNVFMIFPCFLTPDQKVECLTVVLGHKSRTDAPILI